MSEKQQLMARIYMPKLEAKDIEKLKADKPFVMRAHVPEGAVFVGAVTVPSLVDMLGFSGGGGAPAFAFVIDPEQKMTSKKLFFTVMPEHKMLAPPSELKIEYLGVVQSMGMLLLCCSLRGANGCRYDVEVNQAEKLFEELGAYIIDMQPYVVPPLLHAITLQKVLAAQQQLKKPEQDKP